MFSKIAQKRSEMIWRLTAHRMKNKLLNYSNKKNLKTEKKNREIVAV